MVMNLIIIKFLSILLAGSLIIISLMKWKPGWRLPILWMCCGAVFYYLIVQALTFIM